MSTPEEKKRIRAAINKRYRQKNLEKLSAYRRAYHQKHRDEENFKRKLSRVGISAKELKIHVEATVSLEVSQQG